MEPIDILTAQLRDATDEIRTLKTELNVVKAASVEAYFAVVKGRLNTPWNAGTLCPWGEVEGKANDLVTVQDTTISVQKVTNFKRIQTKFII